ncbi:hypothetical protein [Streptomyces sp. NPDC093260]|uniref:hypothetical protein n=1 Tax=Streptomyces sp. NPDC093260 TaxID=3155073 RepID=UPI00344ABBDC
MQDDDQAEEVRHRRGRPHGRAGEGDGAPRGPGHGRDEVAGGPGRSPTATVPQSPAAATPSRSETPDPRLPDPDARPETANGHSLQLLPIGSGLVLIGLGLGLAFVALRLRRS